MNSIFRVRWRQFWKALTQYLWFATLVPLGVLLTLRYIGTGFDYSKTFENASPLSLVIISAVILASMPVFALGISLFLRRASVSLRDGKLQGMNYWGRRKHIPLQHIAAFSIFRSNSVNALVVESLEHGKIYISDQTERLDELLSLLTASVSEPLREKLAALPWHHFSERRPSKQAAA